MRPSARQPIACLLGFGLLAIGQFATAQSTAPGIDGDSSPATRLPAEISVRRSISAGEHHRFEFELEAGLWRIDVRQEGINVHPELIDGKGNGTAFDGPLQYDGTDMTLVEVDTPGPWQLQIRSSNGTGDYVVQRQHLQDHELEGPQLATLRVLSRAGRLYAEGSSESRNQVLALVRPLVSALEDQGLQAELAEVLDYLGTLERNNGNDEQALEDHRRAAAIWQRLDDTSRQARSSNGMGLSLWNLGQADEALQHFENALAKRRPGGDRSAIARTLNNVCLVYHSQGILPKAGACYREALQVIAGEDDTTTAAGAREMGLPRNEGLLRLNLGNVYRSSAEPELAEDNFSRALELLRRAGDESGEAMALNHLAILARTSGRYGEALERYFEALALERRLGRTRNQARVLSNIGFAYFSLGDLERAKGFFQQSLPLRRQVKDRRGEAVTLSHLGNVFLQTGEAELAVERQRQALAIYRDLGNRRGEAATLHSLAESLVGVGEKDQALEHLATGLALLEEVGARDTEAHIHLLRAELLTSRQQPKEALKDAARALELSLAVRHGAGEISSRVLKAQIHRLLGDPRSALEETDRAIHAVETLRTGVVHPNLRAIFLASVSRAFELRIDLEMDLHALDPGAGHDLRALEISERAHARSLLDLVRRVQPQTTAAHAPEADPASIEALRRRYLAAQRRLDAKANRQLRLLRGPHSPDEARLLEQEVVAAISEVENLETQIQRSSTDLLAMARPRAVDSKTLQGLLEPGTVMLEYALGDRRSFVWRIAHDDIQVFTLPPRAELEAKIRTVQAAFSRQGGSGSRHTELQQLQELSKALLAPLLAVATTPRKEAAEVDVSRLVIVPDGAVGLLPFAALHIPRLQAATDAVDWQSTEPLLERFEITHLPSASVLHALRQGAATRQLPEQQVAVLADPVFDRRDPRWPPQDETAATSLELAPTESSAAPYGQPIPFERLPATRREAEAILAATSADRSWIAMGFEANRQAVFDPRLAEFRIVHFATHGWVDDRNPALSGLVLSQGSADGQPRPGLLRLHDIGRLPLNAELVVLSGCQTAVGREVRGEGLIGLGRGFMSAGAQRVAASLWRVQDRATAELMAHFYRHLLQEGATPAAALRAAQRAIRQQRRWRHPYYWAAFVIQGDWHLTSTKEARPTG